MSSVPLLSANSPSKVKPRRPLFQFGLRTLLLVMLAACGALGWLSHQREQARQAWEPFRLLERLETKQLSGQRGYGEPPELDWLRETLGLDSPSRQDWLKKVSEKVQIISLPGAQAGYRPPDQFAPYLDFTPELAVHNQVGDREMIQLARFSKLSILNIRGTLVTDQGMASLPHLPLLTELYLDNTQAGDLSLAYLSQNHKLKVLGLDCTKITDDGLSHLVGLQSLTKLGLDNTSLTSSGLKYLAEIQSLEELILTRTQITDVGLDQLAKMQQLTKLELDGNSITDLGLGKLASLKKLVYLRLRQTKVTEVGIQKLQQALPALTIIDSVGVVWAGKIQSE